MLTSARGEAVLRDDGTAVTIDVHAAEGERCRFDLTARVLSGTASALSESLRGHLFGYGVRFRYAGYRRFPMTLAALVQAGIEEW